jgi:hypothetical protein
VRRSWRGSNPRRPPPREQGMSVLTTRPRSAAFNYCWLYSPDSPSSVTLSRAGIEPLPARCQAGPPRPPIVLSRVGAAALASQPSILVIPAARKLESESPQPAGH